MHYRVNGAVLQGYWQRRICGMTWTTAGYTNATTNLRKAGIAMRQHEIRANHGGDEGNTLGMAGKRRIMYRSWRSR